MSTIEFNKQLLSHQVILKYFALKLTTNIDDAEDLLQETLLKALKYKGKFQEQTNLKSWLHTIMKNTFINNYRREVRKRKILTRSDDKEYIIHNSNLNSISPESEFSYLEIKKTIESLEDQCKIPFLLHNEGFKYKEIAEKLDLPIGTVKSRIFLARQKLSKELVEFAN
jgi:RNA polymerase sigma-70 factor (ECF subfamily)